MSALANARSPFLRHGATQPVKWLPWGAEAFQRAKSENRPVLLDIGAVWCHWCHVMDRESYEDPDTAQIINEFFIPVKVDRDERPDVDARYQRAVQVLTGQGGWPLTAFLTPDGEVFYGGTYFPPADVQGRPAYRRVLREVARLWTEEPARAEDAVRGIRERLSTYAETEAAAGDIPVDLPDAAVGELADSFDVRYGGFGRAPKFPNAGGIDLLLDTWLDEDTDWARRLVAESLTAMARGGFNDQLGGGFHRYSTDARWLIPHFEKMATDNGVLARTYARAFSALQEPLFQEAAEGILAYYRDVAPDLLDRGGFPASQDADYGDDNDGDYWTWTEDELSEALAGDSRLLRVALLRYGIADPGGSMHLDSARHVLFRHFDAQEVAERLDLMEDEARTLIATVRDRLKAARDRRSRPFVDETLYADWVALVASGHLAVARHLGTSDASTAMRALDRVWHEGFDAALGIAHRIGDRDAGEGLSDQVHVADALLDVFEITQDTRYIDRARTLMDLASARFADAGGAFRDRPTDASADADPLARPHYPLTDSPDPSGNGTGALVLLRLHELTGEEHYRERALGVLRAFASGVRRFPSSAATYVKAVARATRPVTRIVVVAEPGDAAGDALFAVALRIYRPRTTLLRLAPGADTTGLPPELVAMMTGQAPRAYLCAGQTCAPPVSSPAELEQLMRGR
jgi:uncharacterized protein YyaL (SSP411 family)